MLQNEIKKIKRSLTMPWLKFLIAPVIGGALGFIYYKFIGCSTGTCPITSNPWISTIYSSVMGLLISFIIKGS
jgi:Family of unknown function (DUF6132)